MKKRRILSCITAAVMAICSLPVLSASADEVTYTLGDVDMDGVITGHDSAMVSRYVFRGDITLTAKQLALADVNGDGVLDTADTEAIHANEVYPLGWILSNSNYTDTKRPQVQLMTTAFSAFTLSSRLRAGYTLNLLPLDEAAEQVGDSYTGFCIEDGAVTLSQVQYNLLDEDANGKVEERDAYYFLATHSWWCVGYDMYAGNGNYMLNMWRVCL